jgi:Fe-S oxidoreductase
MPTPKDSSSPAPSSVYPDCIHPALTAELQKNAKKCVECKLCVKECRFLKKYGTPKQIALRYDPTSPESRELPFECSLCRLCEVVCPDKIGLNPARMFLEMRREAVERGGVLLAKHGRILNYEKRGTSKRYSYYGLPENCDTILFPGCALPGTRPKKVMALFEHLQKSIPSIGIVLDCCTKPSHDLGRDMHFQTMFGEMKEYLLSCGIRNVLVACPNCCKVFKQYGGALVVKTVYEHLAETGLPTTENISDSITIHDPCSTRHETALQQAVRKLATQKSLSITEMKHHGLKTLCCGEGGSVSCMAPELAQEWGNRRKEEAQETRILTYCAGCANFLSSVNPVSHILDLIFEPRKTLTGKIKVARAPFTYLNRILLKKKFKKKVQAAMSRERNF